MSSDMTVDTTLDPLFGMFSLDAVRKANAVVNRGPRPANQIASDGSDVRALHRDLTRKYKLHATAIDAYWRSFDEVRRSQCFLNRIFNPNPSENRIDVWNWGHRQRRITPEWNFEDIACSGPEYLLETLKLRVNNDLVVQCRGPANVQWGDLKYIEWKKPQLNIPFKDGCEDGWTVFRDTETYGMTVQMEDPSASPDFIRHLQLRLIVPLATGRLVLLRQIRMLSALNFIVDDILTLGSQSRIYKKPPEKPDEAVAAAISKLTIEEPPKKLSLPDLAVIARGQKSSLDDHLHFLTSEPCILAAETKFYLLSRPELLADGTSSYVDENTDGHISAAILDAVLDAVKATAAWTYIGRLLDHLEDEGKDKIHRAVTLQELSNVCHLEYLRSQGRFRRQTQNGLGKRWLQRVANATDAVGNPKVTVKGQPDEFTRADPQLHYILRLCHPDTTAAEAVVWIKKLSELHQSHPSERHRMFKRETDMDDAAGFLDCLFSEHDEPIDPEPEPEEVFTSERFTWEMDSLGGLAVIVSFAQGLAPAVSMPAQSRRKASLFITRSQELEAELNHLKKDLDLADFALPIGNLLEPGMAEGALEALDEFIIDKTGSKIGFLYEDLVDDCFADLQNQCDQVKAKGNQEWTPLPIADAEPREKLVAQRKEKEKTRPSCPSAYEITQEGNVATAERLPDEPSKIKVGVATARVFAGLFNKSESRGAVSWAAFEGAMADLGFSVIPKYGSVYTFVPPETLGLGKSFTVHRPHKSHIQGYPLLIFARRLKRTYGWGEETFEVV